MCSQAIHVLTNAAVIANTPEDDEFQRIMQLRSGYEYLVRNTVIFTTFLSPSLAFTLLYALIYSGGVAWLSILYGDFE